MKLKKSLSYFTSNRSKILKYWINDIHVENILKTHNIDKQFFLTHYAATVLQYYFDVVLGKKEIGNCPALNELIIYLKDNNISSDELFLLCSAFKNALIDVAFEENILTKEIYSQINEIYEENFAGLLRSYIGTVKEVEIKLDQINAMVDKYIIMSQTDIRGMIINVSGAFCEISGYSKSELIGKSHNVVRHQDTPDSVFDSLWQTIKSGKKWHGELKNKKKNGESYWVEATIEPIVEQGKIIAYNAIRQDITSKKQVQAQQNMIIEQSKSAAMGEMISMIAHQWRQPLQAVSILTQKLPLTKMIDGELSDEVLNKVVDDVSVQLDYMSKTIDDFRNFFKPDKNKEDVILSQLIQKTEEFLAYMLKIDRVAIEVDYKEDITVSLHLNEVMQVLINIIKNARDAMVDHNVKNRIIKINFYKVDDNVVIDIEDNAGGIDEKISARIFEPYFSTKTNKNGTGLGLYMSKTIIEEHSGGKLSVSNGKHGAIFKITLPLEKE